MTYSWRHAPRYSEIDQQGVVFNGHYLTWFDEAFTGFMDHAGLPLKTVLEQMDLLGEEVVPVLRREFAALKPAHVPDAPTHASLLAARDARELASA